MKCFLEVNHYLRQYKEVRFPYNFIGWTINEPQLKTVPSQPFAAATGIRLLQVYYEVASFPGLYKD